MDLEIGGNDQMFNMLAGRTLMKTAKNKEKFVLAVKLLADPSGKKMGKTEGNMITLIDSPVEMYGKVMSWTDEMILPAFEILTDVSDGTLSEVKNQLALKTVNPRDVKMQLAYEVVRIYLGKKAAEIATDEFKRIFQENQKPADMPEIKIPAGKLPDGKIGVLDLFVLAGLAKSNNEVRRLIKEGAVRIDDLNKRFDTEEGGLGEKVQSDELTLEISVAGLILQRGKKQFVKVIKK